MAEVVLQKIQNNGKVVAWTQAAAGDSVQVGANKVLVVSNADASSHTVTCAVPGVDFTGTAKPDLAVVIPAGSMALIPMLDIYADPTTGQCMLTYDATPATLKRCVLAM